MKGKVRLSPQTVNVFEAFLVSTRSWRYGYDISRETELKSGTLYPILMRLSDHDLLETKWEPSTEPGRPPRHMYRLNVDGIRVAREAVADRAPRRGMKPALHEGGAR
jgi:PadR family transcriptional regulator, regulatory protein PadR